MNNIFRSLSFVILFAGLTASAFGILGFLNTAYADNSNMSDSMGMNATATANMTKSTSGNMTGHTSGNMTGNTSGNMTKSTSGNMTGNTSGNTTKSTSGNMTGNTNTPPPPPPVPKMKSPLQQFKSGTPAKTVQCGQGLSLVIKIEDGSPACVSSSIAQALVARGWGTTS